MKVLKTYCYLLVMGCLLSSIKVIFSNRLIKKLSQIRIMFTALLLKILQSEKCFAGTECPYT